MKLSVKIAGIFAVVAFALTAVSANAAFTRDLTLGSTGADVIELQTWLEAEGFLTIPAGVSKGYFGGLTQAALAKYQASVAITPAAGYFGPITRAKIAMEGGTPSEPGTPSNGELDGDGDVKDFDLKAEDDADSASDDNHIATIEFEVEDGDVELQKVDLTFENASTSNDVWENIESIMLMVDGDEIASVDASDEDEWSEEEDDIFSISIDVDEMFAEDDKVEIEVVIETSDEVETGDSNEDYEMWAEARFINGEDVIFYEGDAADDASPSDSILFSVDSLTGFEITFDENNDSPDTDESLDLSTDLEETLVIVDAEVEDNQDGTLEDATVELVIDLSGTATATAELDIDELVEELAFFIDGDEIDSDDVSAAAVIAAGATGATVVYAFDLDDMEVEAEDMFEIEVVGSFNELEDDSEFIGATLRVSEITIDGENQEGDDFASQDETTSYAPTFTATAGAIDIDFTENPVAYEEATDNTGTIVFTVRVENNTGSSLTGMGTTSNWTFDVEGYGGVSVASVTDEDGGAADVTLADGEDAEYEITLDFTSVSNEDFSVEIEEVGAENVPVAVT